MKKIIISLAIIGVVSAAVIGGTYAYFSRSVTVTGNTFSAGTMTMKLNNLEDDTVGPALVVSNLYPGAFVQSAAMITAGDIALNPEIKLAGASNIKGIADYLYLEVWTDGKLWYRDHVTNFPGYSGVTKKVVLDTIAAGESEYVAFRVFMLETAPNSVQEGKYSVNVVITGHQWNDPDYQPSSPVKIDVGYVVKNWSYNVCGVRQPNFGEALLATETFLGEGYDHTRYSPFYSYRVDSPMVNTDSKWMIQDTSSLYVGGETTVDSTDPSNSVLGCRVK